MLRPRLLYDVLDNSKLFTLPGREGLPLRHERYLPVRQRLSWTRSLWPRPPRPGFVNLKGHRSVGGMRASIYNAMPTEGRGEAVRTSSGLLTRAN